MPRYGLVHLLALEEERLEIIELEVTDDAPAVGEKVGRHRAARGQPDHLGAARRRRASCRRPTPSIEAGDEVLLVLDPGLEEAITAYFAPNGHPAAL